MIIAALLFSSAVFGAVDQYVGSIPGLRWGIAASLASAPWLLLPFVVGATQRTALRASLVGLACTYAAFAAYGLMTLSPIEEAELTWRTVSGFVRSEAVWLLGGLVTSPLFGWFGYRWHTARARAGALLTAGALCLEPLAHQLRDDGLTTAAVAGVEVAVGVLLLGYTLSAPRRRAAG